MTTCWNRSMRLSLSKPCCHGIIWSTVGTPTPRPWCAAPRTMEVHIVEPVAADPSWQAREGTGYDQSAFTIDWEAHSATYPHGKQSRKWQPDIDVAGQEVIQIRFAKKDCQACPARAACTRAKTEPRTITIRTQA